MYLEKRNHATKNKKPLLFESFTGFTVQQFDNIYDKEIIKRYVKHDGTTIIQKKISRKKDRCSRQRPFTLDTRDRFLMILVYYRLYITYTLTGFLFELDQSNICRDIQKIENLIRKCVPIPQKIYNKTKRL